ncbi:transcriptional regulator PadR-like family protein [Burkholderia ambifaria AMMD]|uniref:Transcriptional regulator, PadR family n=1 Tax=Burkholderia ambifaria (strain ATCC BAA-244 / DSM 16087 / CCUG 44356 / LMG 19182 / AMMD) TaxID=339670 RepID=Q0BJK0_BURCM|nr:PadR family transcriptional regulator [Burkholderia ambifaria]ABI85673.1 transcriptional regulator, PadR family [Burkholderia ambifaria AMMD]AJY21263.1 transcriptional regulator PadR-like family protein [Burkholderia ambifaria AMMD]MBR7934111.1 PadR family transcriptional regulator [Burkholderia ambifaria]PEH66987.1 PadR family transcriptional regulator [Burkholderia ambifaria]QQC03963.1 PadR family transcriptional regulator [Burkholderia ambifaria]
MTSSRPSPLALAVLATLTETPMHPYGMLQQLKARGYDEVVNVRQRTSLYQTIDRLLRDGLIAVHDTERDGAFPERTLYTLTEAGHTAGQAWLHALLAEPAREFPAFGAGLAFLPLLDAEDARHQLERRIAALEAERERLESLRNAAQNDQVPRLFLLQNEHALVLLNAELDWARSVVEHLKIGALRWVDV